MEALEGVLLLGGSGGGALLFEWLGLLHSVPAVAFELEVLLEW